MKLHSLFPLFNFLLAPLFGMFFAAGADALAGGADSTPIDTGTDTGGEDLGDLSTDLDDGGEHAETVDPDASRTEDRSITQREEPAVQEFKGSVSARLRGMVKQSPALAQAFKENPQLQAQVEAAFRRDAAYKDVFPTVAEARQMREHFPNGISDVNEFLNEVKEVEELDNDFYGRDAEGNYAGHTKILDNMFREDRSAAVSFYKTALKEWARQDRPSYNEVASNIVGATFTSAGMIEYLGELIDGAKEAKHDGLAKGLGKVLDWAQGFVQGKPKPTPEQEQLAKERQQFDREKGERAKQTSQEFSTSFVSQSKKLQLGILRAHPALQKVLSNKTIPEQKKATILEQVRSDIEKALGKSRAFMNKLRPLYSSQKLEDALTLQKAQWSQRWLLNRSIRAVLAKEIPQLVQANRDSVRRRAGAPQNVKPVTTGDKGKNTPTGPYQAGGRWYRKDGTPFTTAEVIAGKHLA